MRVLLTGATGLVGSAILAPLDGAGHETIALSRRPDSSIRGAIAADIATPGLADQVSACVQPCDAIVHAAASLSMAPADPAVSLTNCLGTQQLLELARRWRTSVFVFLSSVQVIGKPRELPVTEQHPLEPRTAYHASKLYGEHLVRITGADRLAGMTLRLAAPVGRGLPAGRLLSVLIQRAQAGEPLELAGDGTRRQDYVDTADVAAAVLACLERPHTTLLNIASGRSVSNLELAETVVRTVGSASPVTVGQRSDPEQGINWEISIERASAELGFAPARSLEDSISALATAATGR